MLRDDERSALHGAVASSLGLEVSAAPERERRRRVPWGAVAVAAASLAAIVAVVPLAGLLGTAAESDDAATALAVTTVAGEGEDAALPPEPAALEVPGDDRSETLGSVEGGESQEDAIPEETYTATTTVGTERSAPITVDELAGRLAAGGLDLPTSEEGAACADDALQLLGPGAAPLSLAVMVDEVTGIAYMAADASAAAVFDPDGCRRLAQLP
jgi:hypothetical protein